MGERTIGRQGIDMLSPRGKFLLHQGTMMFIEVSNRHSASVVAQGAALARKCLATYQNPLELQSALLGNQKRLEGLVPTAIGAHNKSGNSEAIKKVIVVDSVRAVIKTGFNWASDMMVLEPDHLDALVELRYLGLGTEKEKADYRLIAYHMIHQRRQVLRLPDEMVTQLDPKTGQYILPQQNLY